MRIHFSSSNSESHHAPGPAEAVSRPGPRPSCSPRSTEQPEHQEGRHSRERSPQGGPRRGLVSCAGSWTLRAPRMHLRELGLMKERSRLSKMKCLLGGRTVGMRTQSSSCPRVFPLHRCRPHAQASASCSGLSLMHRPQPHAQPQPHARACLSLMHKPGSIGCRNSCRSLLGPWESGETTTSNAFPQEGTAQPAVAIGTGRESPDRRSSSGLLITAPVASRCPALSPAPAGC